MGMVTARDPSHMTVGEFLAWHEERGDDAPFELVRGVPVRLMAPTNIRHARIQRNVGEELGALIAGARCAVFEAGPGVAIDEAGDECRIPDVVVTCAAEIDETARIVPEPLIVIEVASPSIRLTDVNDKVEFYGRIGSVEHYLVIEQDRRRVVHFRRDEGGMLQPSIAGDGDIHLDPPGIALAFATIYGIDLGMSR